MAQTDYPLECINCGAHVYLFFDPETKEEYWATEMGATTCGRSGNFHVPMTN